jgi:hypothetical protein
MRLPPDKAWLGTRPLFACSDLVAGIGDDPRATSLFQMNSTTSAPIVAVMDPAPWFGP